MLRRFLILMGVINIVGPIVLVLIGRMDSVQPGIGLIGILCLALAEVIRRVERIEKYIALRDSNESGPAADFMQNEVGAIPNIVETMASKLSKVVAKQSNKTVSIDGIHRQGNQYRVSLLIGHALDARKESALIPVASAHEVASWQKAATDIVQRLAA